MGKPSKESEVVALFFNEPSRHWHFGEIMQAARISENRANHWLKSLLQEKLLQRHKEQGRMPYYTANADHANYQNRKKLYALERFHRTGFLRHLSALEAKTVVIFGSFSRSDWHTGSDIDLFIIGKNTGLEKGKFENALRREIQVIACTGQVELKDINPHLLHNIINGYFVKGDVQSIIGRDPCPET